MKSAKGKNLDQLIDQALREYPLDPAPHHLLGQTMEQIERPVEKLRFRISWFDFAFSGMLALLVGFVLDFFQDIARSPYWTTKMRMTLILFWQDLKYFLLHNYHPVLAAALSAAMVIALLMVLAGVYWRYAAYSNRLTA